MTNPVFLDTVGLVALWNRKDQWYTDATNAFRKLIETRTRLLTTTYVLLECGNASSRHPFRNSVLILRDELTISGDLIDPTASDCNLAWQAYQRGEAGDAGIVDHVSFVVMRRLGLTRAFTNDSHFRAAGFEVLF
jgi:predicted nucleic acid-binding protein